MARWNATAGGCKPQGINCLAVRRWSGQVCGLTVWLDWLLPLRMCSGFLGRKRIHSTDRWPGHRASSSKIEKQEHYKTPWIPSPSSMKGRDIKLWMHLILRKRNCRRLVNLPGLPQWPPSTLCLTAHDNSPWTYQLLHMYTRVGKLKILS